MSQLTHRETEVLRLVCQGLRYKEVADKLVISANTVAVHMQRMLTKTGTKSAASMVSKLSGWSPT